MEISKTTQRAQGEEIKRIPIARCPNCGRTVLYSDDPRDKLTVTVRAADESYHGKAMLCGKCKTMLAVIEKAEGSAGICRHSRYKRNILIESEPSSRR